MDEMRDEGWAIKLWIHLLTVGSLIIVVAVFVVLFCHPKMVVVNRTGKNLTNLTISFVSNGSVIEKRVPNISPLDSVTINGSYARLTLDGMEAESQSGKMEHKMNQKISWFERLKIGIISREKISYERSWIW